LTPATACLSFQPRLPFWLTVRLFVWLLSSFQEITNDTTFSPSIPCDDAATHRFAALPLARLLLLDIWQFRSPNVRVSNNYFHKGGKQ